MSWYSTLAKFAGVCVFPLFGVLHAQTTDSRLLNVSTRSEVRSGAPMIAGFVVSPGATKTVLVRAVGPGLEAFGVTGTLGNPTLEIRDAQGQMLTGNDDWGTPQGTGAYPGSLISEAFGLAGAFPLGDGSRDAALLAVLGPGAYTAVVASGDGTEGTCLVEVYEVSGLSLPAGGAYLVQAATGEWLRKPEVPGTHQVAEGGTVWRVPDGMQLVPAGAFTFGNGSSATQVVLPSYCISKYEVTNAEYLEFLTETGAKSRPAHWTDGTYPAGKAGHPVLYVSMESALAYCEWLTARTGIAYSLPSAEQWEKAARGPAGYLYPWGDTLGTSFDATSGVLTSRCNYNAVVAADYLVNQPNLVVTFDNAKSPYYGQQMTVSGIVAYGTEGAQTRFALSSSGNVTGWVNHDTWTGFIYTDLFTAINRLGGTTSVVGSYPGGISGYGCYDMAGNVWEWTTTTSTATNGAEAGQTVNEIRGGSWYATGSSCRSIGIGEGRSPSGAYNTVGFRVVAQPVAL